MKNSVDWMTSESVGGLELALLCTFHMITPTSYLMFTNAVTFQFISDKTVTRYGFLATVEASKNILNKFFEVFFSSTRLKRNQTQSNQNHANLNLLSIHPYEVCSKEYNWPISTNIEFHFSMSLSERSISVSPSSISGRHVFSAFFVCPAMTKYAMTYTYWHEFQIQIDENILVLSVADLLERNTVSSCSFYKTIFRWILQEAHMKCWYLNGELLIRM